MLINKARLARVKNPNLIISFPFRRIIFFLFNSSRVSSFPPPVSVADAGESRLNIGAPMEKQGRGHPRGSKNKASIDSALASSSAPVKRRPGRPAGSKNKPKVPSTNASSPPPRLFSFFCIAGPQCREMQRLPLNFSKFMDGQELWVAILCEHSGGGTPYEVEVWYDGAGEQYFKGSWSQFAEDHDLHLGFFMTFDFHVGTSKFDVKIYDGTQCQKEYEAEVHFH
jgi:hypothetical protein